tara:strand:+ start:85 stop:789 length:705 start_codon:yes stop_codon:yes gene_type:complete
MEILRMLKKLTLLILLVPVVAYSQTTEVTNDVKSHCKSFNDTAFWSEEESLCTVSVKGDKTVFHYVGGWSLKGANGYGQFYEYNVDSGTLMAVYKGQFKNSMFNGLGRLEETYDNSQGESITRVTIGNWSDDKVSGLMYQKTINNLTQEEVTFFGNANKGLRHGNSVLEFYTDENKSVYIANFIDNVWDDRNSKESFLFLDDTVHGWVQHKFFGQDVFLKKSQEEIETRKISYK